MALVQDSEELARLDTAEAVLTYVASEISRAQTVRTHPWRWPSLSTRGGIRIVVLRDVAPGCTSWCFYTDRRSAKVEQLRDDSNAHALFYQPRHATQLRLSGQARLITDAQVRERLWAEQSPRQRANYATHQPPGTVQATPATDLPAGWPETSRAGGDEAFGNFCIIEVQVRSAELLQLHPEGAVRARWAPRVEGALEWLVP